MIKVDKKIWSAMFFIVILFLASFLWRNNRDKEIRQNKKYTIGRITKKMGSLKNGYQWYYEFEYQNKIYEWYKSTHMDYDVKIGEYYLIEFSSKNPNYSRILYEYQLKSDQKENINYIGDTIPMAILLVRKTK